MVAARPVAWAGGPFERQHRALLGEKLELGRIAEDTVDPALLVHARSVWLSRVVSEFRSIQIMNRFAAEVMNAGDPLDVYAWALALAADEVRHTELCADVCRYLGVAPQLPQSVALQDPPEFLAQPFAERALMSAVTMLLINETISLGFIADLAARCTDSAIKRVLDATLDDEQSHGDCGHAYVELSLARFDGAARPAFARLVQRSLRPHEQHADTALEKVARERQRLEAFAEPELARLGLLSPQRQALLYRRTRDEVLQPRLRELGLL